MDKDKLETEKLDFNIKVEKNRFDMLDKHFLETKNRRLLLVSAEFAIFVYLFSDLQNMVPSELYGRIFFGIGVISAIASLAISFFHCRPTVWPDPVGPVEQAKIESSTNTIEWMEVVHKDYISANDECKRILTRHAASLKYSLIFFIVGVIILVIIKFF